MINSKFCPGFQPEQNFDFFPVKFFYLEFPVFYFPWKFPILYSLEISALLTSIIFFIFSEKFFLRSHRQFFCTTTILRLSFSKFQSGCICPILLRSHKQFFCTITILRLSFLYFFRCILHLKHLLPYNSGPLKHWMLYRFLRGYLQKFFHFFREIFSAPYIYWNIFLEEKIKYLKFSL